MTWLYIIPIIILFYITLYPYFEHFYYRIATTWKKKTKQGKELGLPKTIFSFPFGLPSFFRLIKHIKSRQLFEYIQEQVQKHGNRLTYREQTLGEFAIITGDPENIKAVLSTQFNEFGFGTRHKAFYPLLGDGIFTLEGPGWKHSRAMLRPQFTREQISQMSTIETHMKKMLTLLQGHETTPVDIQKLFFKLTIDTATEFLFGESVQSLNERGNPKIRNSESFGNAFDKALAYLADRSTANSFYFLYNSKDFQNWCKVCKEFTDSFVQLALERYRLKQEKHYDDEKVNDGGNKPKYVFLDELVKETQDPVILRDQSLNILLAGRDTTASVLSWTFYLLAKHKPVFFKLRETILEHFGTGNDDSSLDKITFESLKRCAYLKNVLNETLRLYPVVPSNARTATVDTTLPRGGGEDESQPIFVPKGASVFYSVLLMQRDPRIWGPDASEFKPERWETPRDGKQLYTHPWDYLPFNGGPRICLGQQFALNEMSYVIVRILQNFKDIQLAKTCPARLEAQLTLSVYEGVPITLTPV